MMFEGCKGAACKCAAVGVICWCGVAVTHRDHFCQDWGRQLGVYCDEAWDVPHGPHNDQRPVERQQGPNVISTAASTASLGFGFSMTLP